ncbi:MAG: UDP-N-acetylmuramate dehydrogenase [Ginsengibacter sp.]
MTIHENYFLKPLHTFHIGVYAKYFASFNAVDDLTEIIETHLNKTSQRLTLGGGSNILFTKDFDGLVLKNNFSGIEQVNEDDKYVYLKVGAGENWHRFVMYCVDNGLGGVENLSLIPGNTGASPMQNIGAYGVEIKDVFHQLEAFNIAEKSVIKFDENDCEFSYRQSVFKTKLQAQYVILSVTFRLNKNPGYNTSYGAIEQELQNMGIETPSIKAVSDAVINIRTKKLPDPNLIGNAGSFFKNPEITEIEFKKLKDQFPDIVGYKVFGNNIKLAAGWLIEQCGWKGYRKGDAGCYDKQALVLVNYANAGGAEIYNLSEDIKQSVKQKFNVDLEREVNII